MNKKVIDSVPRILVLTPRFPYPVIGGDRLRIYYLCKELAKDYSLTLLSLCESKAEMEMKIPDDGVFREVNRVYLPKWMSYLNVLLAVPTDTPLQVAYYRSRRFSEMVASLIPSHSACLAHLIRTGDYVKNVSLPSVLEMTDAISLNYDRVRKLKTKRNFRTWIYSLEANRLLEYERKQIKNFDLVSLVSDTDKSFLVGSSDLSHVITCSNGVDLQVLPCRKHPVGSRVVAFIGNLTSAQNLDACMHFINDIFPELRARFNIKFRVVGKISEGDAKRLSDFDGVEVTGRVDSISDAVSDVAIGVCPVRIGAGVQNKVLEYMALGIPAITSTIGLEGLGAVPGRDLLVADSIDDYCRHVERILEDEEFAFELSRSGREYVECNHDWSVMIAPLRERLANILRAGGTPS